MKLPEYSERWERVERAVREYDNLEYVEVVLNEGGFVI